MSDSFGHFDHDFEKLSGADDEELVSSSTADISQPFATAGIEVLKSDVTATGEDVAGSADASEFDQLIDFGDATEPAVAAPVAAQPQVASSAPAADDKEGCCWLKDVDCRVFDLLYWRDIKKTGAIFASSLSLLLSLALCSIISVVAYMSLIVLTITISFRLYKTAMGAVQKSGDEHPFKAYLETDISLSEEKVHHYADVVVEHATNWFNKLRHLLLIEDVIDSLKFALLLWLLTYIGSWFNGMTLIVLADVGLFTLPKVYDTYRVQINQYYDVANEKVQDVIKTVQEKVPFLGKLKQA